MPDELPYTIPPFKPINGRILVQQLEYKPSKHFEIVSRDKADINEGYVVALSPHRFGRKKTYVKLATGQTRVLWEHTGSIFPHEVQIGDRVLFPGCYQDMDTMSFGGIAYRALDPWEIQGIITMPRPEGYESLLTGEKTPDKHPLLITV